MIDSRILPSVYIVIAIMSAVVYMSNGDIKKAIYWVAAAVLTITVTF